MDADSAARAVYAVVNPVAGNSDAAAVTAALQRACAGVGRGCEIYRTRDGDDLDAVVDAAYRAGRRRFVVAGGDGTVSAVGAALIGRAGATLALLPVGTANLLARELGVPLELEAACRLAAAGTALRRIDAMRSDGRAYFIRISLGTYSRITERTDADAKRRFGQLAYVWHALPELFGRHSWRFRVRTDDGVAYPRASFIMLTKVAGMGAGELRWDEHIAPDDGRVRLCVVRARSLLDYLKLGAYLLLRRPGRAPKLSYLSASRRVEIDSRGPVPARADGERLGRLAKLEVDVLPAALAVVVPSASENADARQTPAPD